MSRSPLPVREASPPTRLPFRIRTLGRVRHQPHHATAGTYHRDAMLTLVRSGTGFYHWKGEVQRLSRGSLGLVLPSSDPGLMMADPDDPYDHYYCRFAGREALRMARAFAAENAGLRFITHTRWPEVASILDSMLNLDELAPSNLPGWMSQAEGELARLLSFLVVPAERVEARLTLTALHRYFIDHLSEAFELDAMAEHFDVSRFHLSRRARELLGESLLSASRRAKLHASRSLLESSSLELGVAEIALRVGYSDPLYFSKVFRRAFGMSPSRYRAELRSG